MAVDGQMLSGSEIKERGFEMNLRKGRVEVRVPLGGDGGLLKVIKWKSLQDTVMHCSPVLLTRQDTPLLSHHDKIGSKQGAEQLQ